jgi:ATP-dependent DNA helicase RecG
MAGENSKIEKKSLRKVLGNSADWPALAESCVAFATALGGTIMVGIEDEADAPAPSQRVPADLPDTIRRRVGELTVNVSVQTELRTAANGGDYIDVHVPRSAGVPSTTSGRYYIREGDRNRPVVGDEVLRLAGDRATFSWETQTALCVSRNDVDEAKLAKLIAQVRDSDRVKSSVKEKTVSELVDHYFLARGKWLTSLGILCIGRREHRAGLGSAPVIQFLKYDERDVRLQKIVWDDHALSPMDLIDAVWAEVPDFRESYELPGGLFRKSVPVYDEAVVRELLVNALVHRPYTQRGDIFIKSYPDRLEVVNPGLLPIGVTPTTVLHASVRRNDNMARIFHDLKLMEREGSGFDTMYQVLLSQGRPAPKLREGPDRVEVTIRRRIINAETIDLIAKVDQSFQLYQRETICLGLLAQAEQMSARELAAALMLDDVDALRPWLGRLVEFGVVKSVGRTKATRYFVDPDIVRQLELPTATTLGRIEPHRLEALIAEDLRRYPRSKAGEINARIGAEIPRHRLKRALEALAGRGEVAFEGERKARVYWLES